MKQYRLIKEYPGSDHKGIIVSLKTPNGLYEGYQYNYYSKHVENNPEYWEEVVEKDYEIVSYVAKHCDTIIIQGPKTVSIINNMPQDYWKIHSVKRLSDGEVFTIGDSVKVYEYSYIKNITEIIINSNPLVKEGIWLRYDSGSSHLSHAIKYKQPIFLTYDGKDIFEGDTIWWVRKDSTSIIGRLIIPPGEKFNSDMTAYFLTREAAEDYINRNKVLFATEDGVGIRQGYSYYFVDTNLKITLAPNASTGAGVYDERKYFSTYETALYYVIVNAKVLSIEEFWEFVSKPGSNVVKQKALKRLVKERLNLK